MDIKFSKQERAILVEKLQHYIDEELELEIGQFQTDFLLDFVAKELGVYFYNRGVLDALTVVKKQTETISDAIYQLEKPTGLSR